MFPFFFSAEGSESITRESVVSGHTSISSTVPIARFSEEEKKVSVIKAPHYEGIGPVDDSGIPIAIRTVKSLFSRSVCASCVSFVTFVWSLYVMHLQKRHHSQLPAAFDSKLKALSMYFFFHVLSSELRKSLPVKSLQGCLC